MISPSKLEMIGVKTSSTEPILSNASVSSLTEPSSLTCGASYFPFICPPL